MCCNVCLIMASCNAATTTLIVLTAIAARECTLLLRQLAVHIFIVDRTAEQVQYMFPHASQTPASLCAIQHYYSISSLHCLHFMNIYVPTMFEFTVVLNHYTVMPLSMQEILM
jgi:hypothetical protein